MRAKKLAEQLKKAGLTVVRTSEPSYEEDGEVRLSETISVQVGHHYTLLNTYQYKDGDLVSVTHLKDNPSIEYIVQYVKGAT